MSFSQFIYRKSSIQKEVGLTRWIVRLGIVTAALTTSVMILASSVINGFQNDIEKKIFGFWGHVNISRASLTSQYESHPFELSQEEKEDIFNLMDIQMARRDGQTIRSQGGVSHIQSSALLPGLITSEDQFEGIILKGIDRDFDNDFFTHYLRQGRALVIGDSVSQDIVLSEQTAQRLHLSLGDPLSLLFVIDNQQFPRKFIITGIYRTGLEEYDQKFALVDIRRIQQLLKWERGQVGAVEVFLENVHDAPLMADFIYYNILDEDLYAESIKDKYPGIFEWLELQSINEWVILGLMLLVCILNMITTLLILILEKTGMIGILKALGAKDWSIRQIFLSHGLQILSKGLIWGNVLGLGIAFIQKWTKIIPMNEADYYLSYVPIGFDFAFIVMINLITILVVMLFLVVPSIIISRIQPVKALRFH